MLAGQASQLRQETNRLQLLFQQIKETTQSILNQMQSPQDALGVEENCLFQVRGKPDLIFWFTERGELKGRNDISGQSIPCHELTLTKDQIIRLY